MPNSLYDFPDDQTQQPAYALPVEPPVYEAPQQPLTRVYITGKPAEPQADDTAIASATAPPQLVPVEHDPFVDLGPAPISDGGQFSAGTKIGNRLFGTGGEERYQTWPERMVREAIAAPGDVLATTSDNPVTSQDLIEPAQAVAGLAGTSMIGGIKPGIATLGSGPVRQGMQMTSNDLVPTFFSAVEHAVNNIAQPKMTGDQWLGTLANKPGVKPEELQWTGLNNFLKENAGQPVTKQQVQDHLTNNKVELNEVTKGMKSDFDAQELEALKARQHDDDFDLHDQERLDELSQMAKYSQNDTKYQKYQLPGGENYREMLMTLPKKGSQLTKDQLDQIAAYKQEYGENWKDYLSPSEKSELELAKATKDTYQSSHWDEPNILAHVRMNDRTIDGKKSLHLEEIQSDWHQQGREKGYSDSQKPYEVFDPVTADVKGRYATEAEAKAAATNGLDYSKSEGVPDAPFKKTWHELALKRMIREAAEKGYDRLSWTPGEAQAARYDLSKQVDSIKYQKQLDGTYNIVPFKNGEPMHGVERANVKPSELDNIVGKEVAEKIRTSKGDLEGKEVEGSTIRVLSGENLKVGGEGMKGFYDQIIPKSLEKIGKEHGVKVKQTNLKDAPKYEVKNPMLNKDGKEIVSVYKDGTFLADMEKSEAAHYIETKSKADKPVTSHYIDIPQSMKDAALRKGQSLFAAGIPYPLMPVEHDPFEKKKSK